MCTINLSFYYKILNLSKFTLRNKNVFIFYILSSVLSLWLNPFVLIIIFSQTLYCIYVFIFYRIKNNLFAIFMPEPFEQPSLGSS